MSGVLLQDAAVGKVSLSDAAVGKVSLRDAAFAANAYRSIVLGDSPIGYWRLGDAVGPVADSSGNGLAGTIAGGVTLGAASLLAGDPADQAASFDGTSGKITFSNAAASWITVGTIEAWIKTSSLAGSFHSVLTKQNAYGMFISAGVLVLFDWTAGATRSSGVNVADGLVHHIAVTFQSGVAGGTIFYVDGQARGSTLITVLNQTQPLDMSFAGASQFFSGTIDEAALYGSVLTPAQILNHYTAGRTQVGGSVKLSDQIAD